MIEHIRDIIAWELNEDFGVKTVCWQKVITILSVKC